MASRKAILKDLESILLNVDRACRKAEKVALKLDIPSLGQLVLIKTQLEDLIKKAKEKE
mgnify:CR=1 FL=1